MLCYTYSQLLWMRVALSYIYSKYIWMGVLFFIYSKWSNDLIQTAYLLDTPVNDGARGDIVSLPVLKGSEMLIETYFIKTLSFKESCDKALKSRKLIKHSKNNSRELKNYNGKLFLYPAVLLLHCRKKMLLQIWLATLLGILS